MKACNVYTIHDEKAAFYHRPFFSENDATAKRLCAAMVNDPETQAFRTPKDYDLFHIGYWDDETGAIDPTVALHICNLATLVDKE